MLKPGMYTVGLGLDWADSYKPQLEGVRNFLISESMRPAKIYALGSVNPVWHLRMTRIGDLLVALPKIAPLLIKKHDQVAAAIEYLNDRMTGEQIVEAFNGAVRAGTRSGYIRSIKMPLTRSEGVSRGKENLGKRPFARNKAFRDMLDKVKARKANGVTVRDIAQAAKVSVSTIYRGLAEERDAAECIK